MALRGGDIIAKKATTIAIVNQKGGTAKTTTCENLGIGLAMEGKKVLLVDVDPQGSLTISMGWQQPDELPTTLSTLMQKAMNDQPIQPGEVILHHAEGVDLIPANIELAGMEVALVNSMNREKMLKQVLLVQPGMYPQKATIGTELKDFQDAVGGTIAASYPFDDPVAIVYNDEGKLTGLPLNRALRDEDGRMYDAVAGTFLVVGLGEEDFASLSPELAQKYEKQFHQPETFLKLGNRLLVIPVPDDAVKSAENKVVIKPPAEHDR